MRQRVGLLYGLVAAAWTQACASRPVAPPAEKGLSLASAAPPLSVAEPPLAAAAPRLRFQVSAPYLATVLYALDRAASSREADQRYLGWLFGASAPPPWFATYAARRATWHTSRDAGSGGYDVYEACSFGVETIAALVECAAPLLPESDLQVARRALEEVDGLLRARWLALEPLLSQGQRVLQTLASGEQGSGLVQFLTQAAQLPDSEQLIFEVVLVARPRSDLSRAHQAGTHLVLEVGDDQAVSSRVPILFHELAHLAARHAPRRDELERAFVGRGLPGLIAANLWNEAFATAFGNALAARAFDPTFTLDHALYQDAAIDALARALYSSWEAGRQARLDGRLADQLLQLLPSAWPRARWRPGDLLARLILLSDERMAATLVQQGLRPRSVWTSVPLPAELTPPAPDFSSPPLFVAATQATLQDRPDVLERFELDPREVPLQLAAHGPSLYFLGHDEVRLLLSAQTRDGLLEAARALGALPQLPEPGWTALHP